MKLRHITLGAALLLWQGCAAPKAPPLNSPVPPGPAAQLPSSSGDRAVPPLTSQGTVGAGGGAPAGSRAPQSSANYGRSAPMRVLEATPAADLPRPHSPQDEDRAPRTEASLPGYEQTQMMYPLSVTSSGLKEGQQLYERYCDSCHGVNGAPTQENAELSRYGMADLRFPLEYRYGSGRRELFRSIAFGTSPDGETTTPMPAYQATLSKSQMWELANYIGEQIQARKTP